MQDTFVNAYPRLQKSLQNELTISQQNESQSAANSSMSVAGLWLAHGDEPLLSQWLLDALRGHWQQQRYAISRVELASAKTWQEALAELGSLSLFDEATAVVVTGNHKPDKAITAELEQFAQEAQAGGNSSSLLWLTGKLDKRAQKAKWFTPFATLGHAIDCNLYQEQQRQQILQVQAQQFGLQLSSEAWQLLMSHTEHNLLSAYQTLWRLSYLFAPKLVASGAITLNADDLQAALVSNAHFSVFDLSDAMLAGNSAQVVKIIDQLKATDEPTPLVLWTLSKDMRLVAQLMDGQDPNSIGVWSSKQSLYQSACRRQSPADVAKWPDLLFRCDQAIKGLIRQPAWELLLQAALLLSGQRLFAVG
ncbi:MAG: DNA polymerase III subunit delta [Psychrobacter sp.]|nr:DNA polymerase III subunit delta [Psychrobacter sp.]